MCKDDWKEVKIKTSSVVFDFGTVYKVNKGGARRGKHELNPSILQTAKVTLSSLTINQHLRGLQNAQAIGQRHPPVLHQISALRNDSIMVLAAISTNDQDDQTPRKCVKKATGQLQDRL